MINLADKIKNIKLLNQLQLDNKQLILIGLIAALLVYADFNFILKAQIKALGKERMDADKLKSDLRNFETDSKKMELFKAGQAINSQNPLPKTKKVISEGQIESLLQEIAKIANNQGVRILQVKPLRSTPAKFTPLLINLDLTGGYHNLARFINEVENLQVLISAQELRIEPQEKDLFKQRASVILITYVKK